MVKKTHIILPRHLTKKRDELVYLAKNTYHLSAVDIARMFRVNRSLVTRILAREYRKDKWRNAGLV